MKFLPFDRGCPEDTISQSRAHEKFLEVRDETRKRYRPPPNDWKGRVGFGSVYAVGDLREVGWMLDHWHWRHPEEAIFPSWLGAVRFDDDPGHVLPHLTFRQRVAVAAAFAEAANAVLKLTGGEFHARALELTEASAERAAGIHPGDDADVLAVDLMIGTANHKVMDLLTREIWQTNPIIGSTNWVGNEHIDLWHKNERLNAARALLRPEAGPVKLPGMASTRKRLKALHKAWYEELVRTREVEAALALDKSGEQG